MIKILLTILTFSAYYAYPYIDYPYYWKWKETPRYPSYCCPLEWVDMSRGQDLPNDYVLARHFWGRRYAFTRTDNSDRLTGIKSDRRNEAPFGYRWNVANPFPILTNPNKCHLDWFTATKHKEILHNSDEIFFPNSGYTPYGSYGQRQGIPGMTYGDGDFAQMISLDDWKWYDGDGVKHLYVDCKKSFSSLFTLKLVNLIFDQNDIDKLKSLNKRVPYVKKQYINPSTRDFPTSLKFSVPANDSVSMKLKTRYVGSNNIDEKTYASWTDNSKIKKLLSDVKFDTGRHDFENMWKKSDAIRNEEIEIFSVSHKDDNDFEQEIIIPASSKVVVTAFSRPIVGKIPITAVYEVTPKRAGTELVTWRMINDNLRMYNLENEFKVESLRGFNLVFMEIDSGNEVDIDTKITPMENM